MKSDLLFQLRQRFEFSFVNQPGEILAVVIDLNMPPYCGYSFLNVLKQWGQAVMTFLTPYLFRFSTFSFASVSNKNSLPMRRAGSPEHFPRVHDGKVHPGLFEQ